MKELSIEQKAKRYDESLEQLKGLIESTREDKYAIVEEDIIDIFPELKEPEDERIRKWLIGYFQRNKVKEVIKTHDILAWLEKQGKPKWSEEDEKIRKMIINHLTQERGSLSNKDTADAITWLEKQWSPLPMIVNEKEDFYVDGEFDSYSHIVGYISSAFMCYYDNNIPKGKMCLSNMECADIEKAFREQDWAKIERYIKKLGKAVKDMADSICWTPDEPIK